jgi:rhodanese-related sulfurtransferase
MSLCKITPRDAKRLIDAGATLVDIRGADEHARQHIPGARNETLGRPFKLEASTPVIFHCRSGARTATNAEHLAGAVGGKDYLLDGGIDAWKLAGFPVTTDRSQPIEIQRQVLMAPGGLVVLGVALGFAVRPELHLLSAFIGTGLLFAGITGW